MHLARVADGNSACSSYPRRPRDRGVGAAAFCLPRTVSLRLRLRLHRRSPMVRLHSSPGRFSRDAFLLNANMSPIPDRSRELVLPRPPFPLFTSPSVSIPRSRPSLVCLTCPEEPCSLPAGCTPGHSRYLFTGARTRYVLPAIYASSLSGEARRARACLEEPSAGIVMTCWKCRVLNIH